MIIQGFQTSLLNQNLHLMWAKGRGFLIFIFFLFQLSTFNSEAQNRTPFNRYKLQFDTLNHGQQIEMLLHIPYDKLASNPYQFEKLFLDVLNQFPKHNTSDDKGNVLSQLALINVMLGNYDKSIEYSLLAIKLFQLNGNTPKVGAIYADLGYRLKEYNIEKSLTYMRYGISILEKTKEENALNSAYDNYGVLLQMTGKIDSAIFYYNAALNIKINQKDSIGIPFALGHLTEAYLILKEYKKAEIYLQKSFEIRKKRDDQYGLTECNLLYGDLYFAQEKYRQAVKYYLQGYNMSIQNNYLFQAQYATARAALCYEITEDFAKALYFNKLQQNLKDSLLSEKQNHRIAELEIKYETEVKEKEIVLNRKNLMLEKLKVKQRNYVLLISLFVFIFALNIGLFYFKQQKNKQKSLIKEMRLQEQISAIELKNKIYEERSRISRDLHDNIGSQLTFIISSIDNTCYLLDSKDETQKERLQKISNFSKNTISQLRDTIWVLNRNEISFDELKARLLNYMDNAKIAKANIHFSFEICTKQAIQLNTLQGIYLYRIVQEGINNALKYAEASEIKVIISELENAWQLQVQDNGKGFIPNEVTLGNGLENIKNRSHEIGAHFVLISEPQKGTTLKITMPLNNTNDV